MSAHAMVGLAHACLWQLVLEELPQLYCSNIGMPNQLMWAWNGLFCRRCCSKAAVGFETKVAVDIAGERFMGTGLMVTERNWLEVYPYASWGGNANLPAFQQGQQFIPQAIELRQVTALCLQSPSSTRVPHSRFPHQCVAPSSL